MRKIEHTGQFKRDYKRETKGPHRQTLQNDFGTVVTALAMIIWPRSTTIIRSVGIGRTTGIVTSSPTWS
jgi:hypothetical protein